MAPSPIPVASASSMPSRSDVQGITEHFSPRSAPTSCDHTLNARQARAARPTTRMTERPAEGERVRRRQRAVRTLVAGVALGSTGHIAATTVASIAADDIAGTSALSGAPGAAVVLGAAIGASVLSAIMARRGRRTGLATGYAIGVVGAAVAIAGIVGRSLPLLMIGTLLVGFGNSSTQLSRYVAADMYPITVARPRSARSSGQRPSGPSSARTSSGPAGVVARGDRATEAGRRVSSSRSPSSASRRSSRSVFLRPDPFELAETVPAPREPGSATTSVGELLRRPGAGGRTDRASSPARP